MIVLTSNSGLLKKIIIKNCNNGDTADSGRIENDVYTLLYIKSWSTKWQPLPIFLSGESQEQRSLADYSPWRCKESDTIEQAHMYKTGN